MAIIGSIKGFKREDGTYSWRRKDNNNGWDGQVPIYVKGVMKGGDSFEEEVGDYCFRDWKVDEERGDDEREKNAAE